MKKIIRPILYIVQLALYVLYAIYIYEFFTSETLDMLGLVLMLPYVLIGVLVLFILSLGLFIYSMVKKNKISIIYDIVILLTLIAATVVLAIYVFI